MTEISHGHHPQASNRMAALTSLLLSGALLLIKFWAYNLTGSKAILSDAVESIVNVLAAGVVLIAVSYAVRPPDEDHPYGHGKVEYFSSAFEGGMISFAALMIAYEAVSALVKGNVLHHLTSGLWLTGGAGLVNLLLGIYLKQAGKKNASPALESSGEHIVADFWTSFAVIVGLLAVYWTGWVWLDAGIAIAVSFHLAFSGFRIIRRSVAGLTDEMDDDSLLRLKKILEAHPREGLIHFHHVRIIRSGGFHHVDAHVVVPEYWTVDQVHTVTDDFERKIMPEYWADIEFAFHVDPCRRAYCAVCDVKNCPIRQEKFIAKEPLVLAELKAPDEPRRFAD